MKITQKGFAVMDDNRDGLLSRWCENEGLCHDLRVPRFYCPLIPIGGVAVDAGAAIGDHTIAYLDRVGKNGTVYAFEPNPEMFECLKHNCPDAICHNLALGSKDEKASMVNDSQNAGASFIERKANDIGFPVQVVSLDGFLNLPQLDFLKLDIEGMEVEALRGAWKTIMRCRPVIVTEVNSITLERMGENFDSLKLVLRELQYSFRVFLGEEESSQFELIAEPMAI